MRLSLIVSVLLLAGCNAPATRNIDDFKGLASGFLAVESSPQIRPVDPAPVPGDKCPNCNGTGKVGDGRVFVECQKCGGTGKITQSTSGTNEDWTARPAPPPFPDEERAIKPTELPVDLPASPETQEASKPVARSVETYNVPIIRTRPRFRFFRR